MKKIALAQAEKASEEARKRSAEEAKSCSDRAIVETVRSFR
jgi:hypothetical protein